MAHFTVAMPTVLASNGLMVSDEGYNSSYTRFIGLPAYYNPAALVPGANIIHALDATALIAQMF